MRTIYIYINIYISIYYINIYYKFTFILVNLINNIYL